MRRSKTTLLKLPQLRAKEEVREKKGECFHDFQEIQEKKDDGKKTTKMPRNRHKMWQALGLSSLSLRFDTILPPFALAFVLERSTKNEAFEETVLSLFPFLPHLFLRQIRRLKVQNMTCNHILIIRYPLSKLTAGPKIDSRGTLQVTVWGIEMLFSTIHCYYLSDKL